MCPGLDLVVFSVHNSSDKSKSLCSPWTPPLLSSPSPSPSLFFSPSLPLHKERIWEQGDLTSWRALPMGSHLWSLKMVISFSWTYYLWINLWHIGAWKWCLCLLGSLFSFLDFKSMITHIYINVENTEQNHIIPLSSIIIILCLHSQHFVGIF